MRYPLTSGQPPSLSGRNASAAGIVARIFMPAWDDVLDSEQIEALWAYVITGEAGE